MVAATLSHRRIVAEGTRRIMACLAVFSGASVVQPVETSLSSLLNVDRAWIDDLVRIQYRVLGQS